MRDAWLTPVWTALDRAVDPGWLWALGLTVGVMAAVQSARRAGLDPRRMYWAAICAAVGGVYGSHLLGLVVFDDPAQSWLRPWQGGKVWYGGLIGGGVAALAYLRLRRGPIGPYADAITPGIALGYAIGRVGCFIHGDDFGVVADHGFSLRYGPDSEGFVWQMQHGLLPATARASLPVVPVQLYHALLGLALCALLWRPRAPVGSRLAIFLVGYGVGRIVIEHWRGDFHPWLGPLSPAQSVSMALIAGGLVIALARRTPVEAMA